MLLQSLFLFLPLLLLQLLFLFCGIYGILLRHHRYDLRTMCIILYNCYKESSCQLLNLGYRCRCNYRHRYKSKYRCRHCVCIRYQYYLSSHVQYHGCNYRCYMVHYSDSKHWIYYRHREPTFSALASAPLLQSMIFQLLYSESVLLNPSYQLYIMYPDDKRHNHLMFQNLINAETKNQ